MLHRIRFEAEAPDPATCRRDIFAAIHQLLGPHSTHDEADIEDPAVYYSSWVTDEHYERLPWNEAVNEGQLGEARIFKGRVVLSLPVNEADSYHATPDGMGIEQGWQRPQKITASFSGSLASGSAATPPPPGFTTTP